MIKVTDAAHAQIKAAAEQSDMKGLALRLAARKKEDGAFDYIMGFDEIKPDDEQVDCGDGVIVLVGKDHLTDLNGTTLDFVEIENGEHRFIFSNPNDPDHKPATEE